MAHSVENPAGGNLYLRYQKGEGGYICPNCLILLESLLIVGSNLGAPLGSFVIKFIMNPGESDISSERFQQILVSRGLPSQPEPCQVCLGYFY